MIKAGDTFTIAAVFEPIRGSWWEEALIRMRLRKRRYKDDLTVFKVMGL